MKQIKLTNMKKLIIASVLSVLTVLISVLAISSNAETAAEVKAVADEKSLVKMTASISRANDASNLVNIDTLTEQLNKYAGSGVATVAEESSDTLKVTFAATSREYQVDINTGMLFETTYTITYNANGGTGAPSEQTKTHDEDLTLSDTIPTRTDYTFAGWGTSASSTSVSYLAGGSYTSNADITLYAIWVQTTTEFAYTGEIQTFTVPVTGTYKLEVWGAQGGSTLLAGGLGGYSYGNIALSEGETIYIVVGGKGGDMGSGSSGAGYNGGGQGCSNTSSDIRYGGGGGGATHIAKSTGLLSTLSEQTTDILIVAGGGGGAGSNRNYDNVGGTGGGASGGNGGGTSYGEGGSQTDGGAAGGASGNTGNSGSFGQGGDGLSTGYGSGGGGGFYGGGGGGNYNGTTAAGGGSGYIDGVSDGNTSNGVQSGDGSAKITFLSVGEYETYKIEYNANGGTGTTIDEYKLKNIDITILSSSTFTAPSGYHFVSWNTSEDGTGTTYSADATYTANEELILYAIWETHDNSSCYETCGGTLYTVYGSHYVHKCRTCGNESVNSSLADLDATEGADCDTHGPCDKKLLICGGTK